MVLHINQPDAVYNPLCGEPTSSQDKTGPAIDYSNRSNLSKIAETYGEIPCEKCMRIAESRDRLLFSKRLIGG